MQSINKYGSCNYLPGDRNITTTINQIIKVNHSGEYGAFFIYQGQLKGIKKWNTKLDHNHSIYIVQIIEKIEEMLNQESIHLKYFENLIHQSDATPSILTLIWRYGGFLLGWISSYYGGSNAAMICTDAVESVIDEHYTKQLLQIDNIRNIKISIIDKYNNLNNFNNNNNSNSTYQSYNKIHNKDLFLQSIKLSAIQEKIEQFRQEEIMHQKIAKTYAIYSNITNHILYHTIKIITRISIEIAKRL